MQWPLVGRGAALGHGLETLANRTGIALLGPAGVGKSRLLHELAERAELSGMAVVRTAASASTRSIPFGPFVDLLPGGPTQDRLAMLGAARASLESRQRRGGLVLTVDDAHHLDETSLAFLISIVSAGIATIALTARTGEPMAADLVDLWTNGVIERVDIGPLERSDVQLLLQARLGDVSPELEEELWRLAAGNPLVLHELIEGAIGEAIAQDPDGKWIRVSPIAKSTRLYDLVASRLRGLPDEVRPAMDTVAVGSPLPLSLARRALGLHLSALEDANLVAIAGEGVDRTLMPAHPLYGEILKSHIGGERTRIASRRLVEAAVAHDEAIDPLRVALWQRDCGDLLAPDLAVAGAQEALVRHEPGLVEEILRPLGTEDDRVALLLGRALSYRQRFAEADAVLADREPAEEALRAEISSIRAQNMGFGLGRVNEARSILHETATRMEDPDLRARLINERAMVSGIHGDFVDSRASSELVLDDPETSAMSRAAAYVTLTVALAMTADCDRMDQIEDDALVVAAAARDVLPFAADQIGVMRLASAIHAGRLQDARRLGEEALERTDRGNAMTSTWMSAMCMVHEFAGRLVDARATAEAAAEIFAVADPFGLEAQVRGLLGVQKGQMGESVTEDTFALNHPQAGARLTAWLNRGRVWSAAARGDIDSALETAVQAGRETAAGEHFAWASFCFHDAVRLGGADLVVDDLRAIDSSHGAHLIEALKRHGESVAEGDANELAAVARRFITFGCWLLGAEAFAQASTLYERGGSETDAARCAALSQAAQGRCQQPSTPALSARPNLVTEREIEVALDAVRGLTSPEISKVRYISVRTVDNHLSSVYRKLGVSGRDELGSLLTFVG